MGGVYFLYGGAKRSERNFVSRVRFLKGVIHFRQLAGVNLSGLDLSRPGVGRGFVRV
jgi:hypothetical protein